MRRTLCFEQLEDRLNFCGPCDVNADGVVTPIDALNVINAVHNKAEYLALLDTNQDGVVSPLDALKIVNHLNSQIKVEATHKIYYSFRDLDTYGWTEIEVRGVFFSVYEEFQSLWDIEFVEARNGERERFTVTTTELWSGQGTAHWGGLFNFDTNILYLHNGWVSPYHHDGKAIPINEGFWWKRYKTREQMYQIVSHEILHSLGIYNHPSDTTCRSHFNAPPTLCSWEDSFMISLYGKAKGRG